MSHIDDWLTHLLNERTDKSWTPSLHCSPDLSGEVAGLTMTPDAALPPLTIVVRSDKAHTDPFSGQVIPAGSEVARYEGVHATVAAPDVISTP